MLLNQIFINILGFEGLDVLSRAQEVNPRTPVIIGTGSEEFAVQALAAFRASPEAFDLVITDKAMPGMAGTVREVAVAAGGGGHDV